MNDKNKTRSLLHPKYTYREHLFITCIAMVLSFNSGFSNGVSLSGFLTPDGLGWDKQSTSGYTGVYTASALALPDTNNDEGFYFGFSHLRFFGFQICMILSFVTGSCISALLNPRPAPWRLAPMYALTFFIGAVFMSIAALLATFEAHRNSGITHLLLLPRCCCEWYPEWNVQHVQCQLDTHHTFDRNDHRHWIVPWSVVARKYQKHLETQNSHGPGPFLLDRRCHFLLRCTKLEKLHASLQCRHFPPGFLFYYCLFGQQLTSSRPSSYLWYVALAKNLAQVESSVAHVWDTQG